jgi:signal transduction histidine kinase/CheY-like chemotaxis protein
VILAEGGEILFSLKSFEADRNFEEINDGVFDVREAIVEAGEVFGYVDIGFSAEWIEAVVSDLWWALSLLSMIGIMVSVLITAMISNYVTRRLQTLERAAARIERGDYFGTLLDKSIYKKNGLDELSKVLLAFERMRRNLSETYSDLSQAKQEAERASDVKTDFLANMSHEIRTPLNGVISALELLLDARSDEERDELIQMATESSKHLKGLVSEILDLSRVVKGNLVLQPEPVSLTACMKDIAILLAPVAHQRGVEFVTDGDELELPNVIADPGRLRQVLINLAGNALKFAPEDGVVLLRLLVEEPFTDSLLCRFAIYDNGPGIPTEEQEKIFEQFHQVEGNLIEKTEGTGLGLTIAQNLAKQMKGEVLVYSRPGVGTQFVFEVSFPCTDQRLVAEEEERNCPGGPQRKILIAEDRLINQRLLKKILEGAGHTVLVADDGERAVELWESERPEIIFMDLQMPGMDGFQATREIRSREAVRAVETPVVIIACTAHAVEGFSERCNEAGMNGFVAKPYERKAILKLASGHSSLLNGLSG